MTKTYKLFVWLYKLSDFAWRVRRSIFKRYNIIKINSLDWGCYADPDVRLFHGAFDLLVDFVEGEFAWSYLTGSDIKIPWWQTHKRYLKKHAEELADKCFDWSTTLADSPTQAQTAAEVREIYNWYKYKRPNRPSTSYKRASEALRLEEEYRNEDTEYFIRLVKIRGALWT